MKYLLIFLLLFPILDAAYNYFCRPDNFDQFWFHFFGAATRATYYFFILYTAWKIRINKLYRIFQWGLVAGTTYWIIFDIFYNIFSGQHILYLGNTALLDKLGVAGFYLKVIFLIGSVIVVISTFLAKKNRKPY